MELTIRPKSLPETCLSAASSFRRVNQLLSLIALSASANVIVGQSSHLHREHANSNASLFVFSPALLHNAARTGSSDIRRSLMSSMC